MQTKGDGNFLAQFEVRLGEINALIELPTGIREQVISSLEFYLKKQKLTPLNIKDLQNIIDLFKNVSDESIQRQYQVIYNQLCILSVSALSAILEKIFIHRLNQVEIKPEQWEDLRINLPELLKDYGLNLEGKLGSLIVDKDARVSFQDLQSIKRSFAQYADKKIKLSDAAEQHIIFYQQARHVLVHMGGDIDPNFLKRVSSQNNIRAYKLGDKVRLGESDWTKIKKYFCELVTMASE